MLDIPAQSSNEISSSTPPVETTNEPPDRFAILDEAEKRVHDLLDSSSANKVLEQAENITTEAETSEQKVDEVSAQEVEKAAQTEADNAAIEKAQQSIREAETVTKPLEEVPAATDQETVEPENIPARQMAESFTSREQLRAEVPTASENQEIQKPPQISERESQDLIRQVTQFEEKEDSNEGILRVEDIESASRTINPLSFSLTKEQDRREVGIRAAIEAHHEKLKAA